MSIVVPDEVLTATRMTEAEMRQEIAVMLFHKEKLTLAQASRFAGMHRIALTCKPPHPSTLRSRRF